MHSQSRRNFIKQGGVAAVVGAQALPMSDARAEASSTSNTVFMDQDGLGLTPAEVSAQLARLCQQREPAVDSYMLGGEVEEVERYFAKLLGKERALFMPSGTLANQLALRALAGNKRRVIVQEVSHIYNDTGDASQSLSGLTVLPLAPERASFTWAEVEKAIARTVSGRVHSAIGALSIETPIRRRAGELFDHGEMQRICAQAKLRDMGTHLDGARLFIASAYTGITPAEYAAPFDTVYVSMWKYFNALNGAILAGPNTLLDSMYHTRRMFGGALFNAWPFALLARHYAEGFIERLRQAIAVSKAFMSGAAGSAMAIEAIANGTNIFRLSIEESKAERFLAHLRQHHIVLAKPQISERRATFHLFVNETWNRRTAEQLVRQFQAALGR